MRFLGYLLWLTEQTFVHSGFPIRLVIIMILTMMAGAHEVLRRRARLHEIAYILAGNFAIVLLILLCGAAFGESGTHKPGPGWLQWFIQALQFAHIPLV